MLLVWTVRGKQAPPIKCPLSEPDFVLRLPLWNAIGYVIQYSRSHDAVIRVYDEAGNVIETHEHKGDFKEW